MARRGYMYGPLIIYRASASTARPTNITDSPTAWTLLARSSVAHYHEDGVMVTTSDTYNDVYALGSTAPQDSRLTQRVTRVTARIMDAGADVLAALYGDKTVTTVAASSGVPGTKEFELDHTSALQTGAVLLRGTDGPSSLAVELYLPEAIIQTPNIEMSFVKGEPVSVNMEFIGLQNSSGSVGIWREQTAPAT